MKCNLEECPFDRKCERKGCRFGTQTKFDVITASPEILAEAMVYEYHNPFFGMVWRFQGGEQYGDRADAIQGALDWLNQPEQMGGAAE